MLDPALRAALADPAFYPEPTTRVEVRETHISLVFLTDRYAYKLKKPVDLGFLDYSTLARRRFYCLQELLLNRRLSPDVYLAVLPIRRGPQGYVLDGEGALVDYVLKMRRLPDERTLQSLLQRGEVPLPVLERLAQQLAAFHQAHPLPTPVTGYGSLAQVRHDWEENFAQAQTACPAAVLPPAQAQQIREAVQDFLARRAGWFAQRCDAGRIRDCHGDLRAEHIYLLPDGELRILDCIEFNKRFRYIDVASEVAFLAMDLERLGFASLAHGFVAAYARTAHDASLYRLLDFYVCYRAYVRGKVACLRLREAPGQEEVARDAARCFALAARYAARCRRPLLLLTSGLIGSGKSTLAAGLAAALDLRRFSSDCLRKQLAGLAPETPQRVAYGTGIYSAEATRRTYERLAELAEAALHQGESVILDASFAKRAERQRCQALAARLGAECFVLECLAPPEVIRQRLAARQHQPSVSDGRWELFAAFQRDYEPVTEFDPAHHLRIATTGDAERSLYEALAAIHAGRS
ncbi:MAG: kinase [Candidatus Tectimicrobiota bacterium]|nr:MAG: kinase [Candidatus Tectomicrobia bacterium]